MLGFVIKMIIKINFRFSGRTLFSGPPQTFFILNSCGKLSKIRFLGYLIGISGPIESISNVEHRYLKQSLHELHSAKQAQH